MERLFLAVAHNGIRAGYLIVAVILARILLRKAPKNMICVLWIIVGLRLICPVSIETAFSLLPQRTNLETQMRTEPQVILNDTKRTKPSSVQNVDLPFTEEKGADVGNMQSAAKVLHVAAAVWIAGSVVLCAYLIFSWYRIKKKTTEAVPAQAEGIRFYQCDRIASPFLLGLISPKIYVPFSISGQELSYVLQHEQAHKRRYDHLVKFAGYLLLAVYWFQPLVWAAYLMLGRDIELACDERVVKQIGEDCKKAYSQALLSCSTSRRTLACPVAFGEIGVKDRVKNILNYKKPGKWIVFAAAVVCVMITVCFATEAKSESDSNTQISSQKSVTSTDVQLSSEKSGTDSNRSAVLSCVEKWADAFCGRDAQTVYDMLEDTGRKQLSDKDMLDGNRSFGWSSPWPWDVGVIDSQKNYQILSANEESASILYYAWTSDPHVTVWKQIITYQYVKDENRIAIGDISNETLDDIHTADEFYTAYPNGVIDGTRMDYVHGNEAKEALQQYGLLNDQARVLRKPDTAAVFLLNIQDDPSVVETEVSSQNGDTIVTFHFLEDGSSARVKMIQPQGEGDIWVPQSAENEYGASQSAGDENFPIELLLASGASSSGTTLTLQQDFSFEGQYFDHENAAGEDYPNGIRYVCDFSGQFKNIKKINTHTHSMTLDKIAVKKEEGEQWIEDGELQIASRPYGVEGGKEFLLYMPGTPYEELSEEFLSQWMERPDDENEETQSQTLPCYGLFNIETGQGFFGYEYLLYTF